MSMTVYVTNSGVSSSAAVLMGGGPQCPTNKQTKGYLLRQPGARHAEDGQRTVPSGAGPLPLTQTPGQTSEQVGGIPR